MSMFVYLDCETLASNELLDISELKCPGNIKKPESIAAWRADPARQDDLHDLHRKTALDPFAARIFCIAFAINDDPVQVIWDDEEEIVMRKINAYLEGLKDTSRKRYEALGASAHIVGYNIKNFDNSFLKLRALKYKLSLLNQLLPHRSAMSRIEDVMEYALVTTRFTVDKYVSQDKVCKYFGLKGKGEMDGSMVMDYYLQGKKQEIADYCKDDVEQMRQLHQILCNPVYLED
jgi:3'-5' exonuclease